MECFGSALEFGLGRNSQTVSRNKVAFGELSDPAVTLALLVGSESIRSYLNERLFADFVL